MMTLANASRLLWIEEIMALVGRATRQPRRLRSGLERLPLEHLQRIHQRLMERLDRTLNLER